MHLQVSSWHAGAKCRFAHPYLAFMMFIPGSLVGLLIPRIVWSSFPLSQDVSVPKTSREVHFHSKSFIYSSIRAKFIICSLIEFLGKLHFPSINCHMCVIDPHNLWLSATHTLFWSFSDSLSHSSNKPLSWTEMHVKWLNLWQACLFYIFSYKNIQSYDFENRRMRYLGTWLIFFFFINYLHLRLFSHKWTI